MLKEVLMVGKPNPKLAALLFFRAELVALAVRPLGTWAFK